MEENVALPPMAGVAQLVRASGCGSEGRGFNSLHSPQVIFQSQLLTLSTVCDRIDIWASSSAALSETLRRVKL